MRLTEQQLADYLADLAELLERHGVGLDLLEDERLDLDAGPAGSRSFEIVGFLPDGRRPPLSTLTLREQWRATSDATFERAEYEYELLDHERGFRRAFHLHDADYFVRVFLVAVHEHCERPVGSAHCPHFAGEPIRDGYAAAMRLIELWMDPAVPNCNHLSCLE
ncbi:MAG: hypothetical protein H0X16_09950 [Chloroflexi bacterium]|nr:hypothetical protein [Chloroflexota bacterium]